MTEKIKEEIKKASAKITLLKETILQLAKALPTLKESLGEKKFDKRIKKAAKLLIEGIKVSTPKKATSPKKAAAPKKVAPSKKAAAPKKAAPSKKAAPAKVATAPKAEMAKKTVVKKTVKKEKAVLPPKKTAEIAAVQE